MARHKKIAPIDKLNPSQQLFIFLALYANRVQYIHDLWHFIFMGANGCSTVQMGAKLFVGQYFKLLTIPKTAVIQAANSMLFFWHNKNP